MKATCARSRARSRSSRSRTFPASSTSGRCRGIWPWCWPSARHKAGGGSGARAGRRGERRAGGVAAWRGRWETDVQREAWRLQREAVIEMQNETMAFEEELLEKRFRRTLKSYLAEHGEPGPDGKPHVRILRRLRALFGGGEFVPAAEFELELRRLLHQAAEDDETRREGMDRHKQIVALLTELRAQAEQRPLDEAAIERDVKLAFRRLFLAQMKRLEATERWVDIEED